MLLFGKKKFFFAIKEMINKNIISLNIDHQITNYNSTCVFVLQHVTYKIYIQQFKFCNFVY